MSEPKAQPQQAPRSLSNDLLWPAYLLYGVVNVAAFAVLALLAVVAVLLLPRIGQRRAAAHWTARTYLVLGAMPLRIHGSEHLPAGQCVVVANHASYLDGPIMKAALPPRFAFVVKREMDTVPLAGFLLRRIGSEFVERFNRHKGANDARRMLRSASGGQAFAFFPEGTFSQEIGLLKFHTGAFTTAVRAGCPVVPAVIRGSRANLPSDRWLPRWGAIDVEFLPPLTPAGDAENAAIELRDRTRAQILARLGEPDLS